MDYTKYDFAASKVGAIGQNEGLRTYMLRIYNYMAGALALTGGVSMMLASSPAMMNAIYGSGAGMLLFFIPFALSLVLGFKIQTMQTSTAQLVFWLYAGSMGLSLAPIFMIYTGESIARTFFITASVFGSMSLYGYTTKKDLTGMGSFLFMGLIGIILASLVNMFMHSSGLNFAISIFGVLIFTGLTAWDTQKLKQTYYVYAHQGDEVAAKMSIIGALQLYLDFVNLFMYLIRFLGVKRND